MSSRRFHFLICIFAACVLTFPFFRKAHAGSFPEITDEQIDAKLHEAGQIFQVKYRQIENGVNARFKIRYSKLMKEYEAAAQEFNQKFSFLSQIPDPLERGRKIELLKKQYQNRGLQRYIEAYYYFQNELEEDHLFMGKLLENLEEILNLVLQKDPVFRETFFSEKFQEHYGLLLKRVVWSSQMLKDVSSETVPLNVHSVFGNKSKIPILVKITPQAFNSLAFLRSILVHELNHFYLFKDPKFADATPFEGAALKAAEGPFSHYFTSLNPADPSYQYHLIHEFYSLKSQLLFDQRVPANYYFRLDSGNKERVENMFAWTYQQLNIPNQNFVKNHPDPPVLPLINKYYS